MSLPLILDVALGLVLIYLLLSLLASEIQELIATLLQWRADHLKKSIEILMTGSAKEQPEHRRFTQALYRHPAIQSLNHRAKGNLAAVYQSLTQRVSRLCQRFTHSAALFPEQGTGPSYIPGQAFAIALLKKLRLDELAHTYSELLLQDLNAEKLQMVEDLLAALRNSMGDDSLLVREYEQLKHSINTITTAFVQHRSTLAVAQARSVDQLVQFSNALERQLGNHHYCKEIIRQRLPYLQQAVEVTQPEPTVSEVIRLLTEEDHYERLPPALMEVVLQALATEVEDYPKMGLSLREALAQVRDQGGLPPQLRESLQVLAAQADERARDLTEALQGLQTEVEVWFNRSMDRASGVYKRNAKGVAILIGIGIAIATNADTFHMMSRLARDSLLREALREAVTQTAQMPAQMPGDGAIASTSPPALEEVESRLNQALTGLPLPLGWSPVNVEQQVLAGRGWRPPLLRRILSWILTGIAISMGASFWYGILSRVAPIRNTGKPVDSDDSAHDGG
jgi:hypothetical protein